MIKLFKKLVAISSPSGFEGAMTKYLKNYFDNLVWETWVDDYGNLYALKQVGKNLPTVVFCAHQDTVQSPKDQIKILFDGETFKSNGKTILGADNKSGLAILMTAAKSINHKTKNNILYFFPVHEEAGVMGSSFFKFAKGKIKYIFNVDNGDKPGVFVNKALGYKNFKIELQGLTAHAAKDYAKGKNAIIAAAKLILALPIGKNEKNGTTMNIGIINGGSGTNVVCDHVGLKGESRAFTPDLMIGQEKIIKQKCENTAKETGVTINFLPDDSSYIPPLDSGGKKEIIDVCETACKKLNLQCEIKTEYSTSDANFFSGFGYETVCVSAGGRNAHSVNESIKISDMIKTTKLINELVNL